MTIIELLGNYVDCNEGLAICISLCDDEKTKIRQKKDNSYEKLQKSLEGELLLCDLKKAQIIEKFDFPADYVFILIDPLLQQNNVDFNTVRKNSCKKVLASIREKNSNINVLSDISLNELKKYKDLVDFVDYKRACHIISEKELILKGIQSLKKGDITLFGSYLYISHESLRNDFEASSPEIDYLVEISKNIPGCIGAKLCYRDNRDLTLHIVKKEEKERYISRISIAFRLQTTVEPEIITI